jgi:TetR/AcrR family transcriptional regulator, biofilm operon repressor
MKDKIIKKATDMFLKLGFKSVTMDDIAGEILIEEGTAAIHNEVHQIIDEIVAKNYNAIEENFEIRKMFKEMFMSVNDSPIYQLKKHYPEIYTKMMANKLDDCNIMFRQNIVKGIEQGLYRENLNVEIYIKFYYMLIFTINETIASEQEALELELDALEYHTRAMATLAGIIELEKQLLINN